jgi:triosephosphate isomerase
MRQKIVAGNWKMNLSAEGAVALAEELNHAEQNAPKDVALIVCPPFPFIHSVKNSIDVASRIALGAQDVSANENGAFTGDVSAEMLQSLGVRYVIIGHSERRKYHGESGEILKRKLYRAHSAGMKTIYCVGEQLSERKDGSYFDVIKNQLAPVLDFQRDTDAEIILAYEPVWAIGTGEVATPKQAQEVHAFIRERLNESRAGLGDNTPILYGGSCKPDNAADLFACVDIDGGLIGGAALSATDFLKISKQF